jgi:hypothetical protein
MDPPVKCFVARCIVAEITWTLPSCIREHEQWFQKRSILNNINPTTENDALVVGWKPDCLCQGTSDTRDSHLWQHRRPGVRAIHGWMISHE